MYAMFAVVYICCRGRAVTNVVRTCSPSSLLKRQLNMFKLEFLMNCALQHNGIKILMDVYQTVLANPSPLGNVDVIYVKENRLISVLCIIQTRRFLECSEVPVVGMLKVSYICYILTQLAKSLHPI